VDATRIITIDDAPVMAQLLTENREFMAPWEPVRSDEFYTESGQRKLIKAILEREAQGVEVPHVILDPAHAGKVVGRITLSTIVRGPFQSCSVGYWVSGKENGRGLASAAVAAIKRVAFENLGLHRVEAGTLKHNVRSQKVLERNGFERFGMAPSYLKIAGAWQDHILFQVLNPDA
jgi:ribosomal-protein-alanine N-acetyltransferase